MTEQEKLDWFKLIADAREVVTDFSVFVSYDGVEDEVGVHACCGTVSYKPHSETCHAINVLQRIQAVVDAQ